MSISFFYKLLIICLCRQAGQNFIHLIQGICIMVDKNKIGYAIGLLFALALGIYATQWWYGSDGSQRKEESQVLLEHVKNVSKLITTEGYFSEIYSEEDTKSYYLFSSTKKILIKVKAKVSAGYDLEKMQLDANPQTKTLTISNIPEPSILSVEPDITTRVSRILLHIVYFG